MGNQSCSLEILLMQFFVKTLTGNTITIEAELDFTVADVKNQISLEEGIQFAQQKLIVGGKVLEDSNTLAELGVQEDSTIDLVINMQGGTASTMDPAIVELSKKYNHDKKICRKCYATYHQEPKNAERDHAVTGQILDQERLLSK